MKFGLCCIHAGLQEQGYRFQTMTWKRFSSLPREEAVAQLSKRYENNLEVIWRIISECVANGWTYRVSSDILPLMTHPESGLTWDELPNVELLNGLFERCATLARMYEVRLSCHPDQFNVLASTNQNAVENTIRELNHHGWFMSKMGAARSYDAPINIHINGAEGGAVEATKRFVDNMGRLTEETRSRLVVEVEDKGTWSARTLLEAFYSRTSVPITFDYLHHACNSDGMTEEEAYRACHATWPTKPLFHYCEGIEGDKNPRRHADMPLRFPNLYGLDADLDLELKGKDRAIIKMGQIYAAQFGEQYKITEANVA